MITEIVQEQDGGIDLIWCSSMNPNPKKGFVHYLQELVEINLGDYVVSSETLLKRYSYFGKKMNDAMYIHLRKKNRSERRGRSSSKRLNKKGRRR